MLDRRGDDIVQVMANLICQLKGEEACTAINKIIDTHTETERYLRTQGRVEYIGVGVLWR